MEFLNPSGFWFVLLTVPVLLFYLLRPRRREKTLPAVLFWDGIAGEQQTRMFWQRFRYPLSLLLSLLFLLFLTGAFSDPVLPLQKRNAAAVVIVDNSASMNVKDGSGRSRLDEAKSKLRQFFDSQYRRSPTAVITASGEPLIAAGFTDSPALLKEAVQKIPATDNPSSLGAAVETAELLLAQNDSGDSPIFVFTDGCSEDISRLITSKRLVFFPVGKPANNTALTRFHPRRSLSSAAGYEVLAEVSNFGTLPVECRLRIVFEETLVELVPLTLPPGTAETVCVSGETSAGGVLWATLEFPDTSPPDALEADNTAYAVLPPRPPLKILFYGEDNFLLQKVLESQQNALFSTISTLPETVPPDSVLVLHRIMPPVLPEGNILIVSPQTDCRFFRTGLPLATPPAVSFADFMKKESPLLRYVHLDDIPLPGARKLSFPETGDAGLPEILLATAEEDPLYLLWHRRNGKMLVFNTEIGTGTLEFRTAFPIMLSNAMNFFRNPGGDWEPVYKTGEAVVLPVDSVHREIRLCSPDGTEQILPVENGTVLPGGFSRCGIWEAFAVRPAPGTSGFIRQFACGLMNPAESQLAAVPAEFYTRSEPLEYALTGLPLHFWLTLAALCLTAADWHLFHRRWLD
ncbi:MAG: BatA and WFA domain-containing protein [Planctomycetaceae bacterium]|jgi:hypothetical protein|nr:BatA and WFA domain-containing protein [Planctomycetaceae bacterium]